MEWATKYTQIAMENGPTWPILEWFTKEKHCDFHSSVKIPEGNGSITGYVINKYIYICIYICLYYGVILKSLFDWWLYDGVRKLYYPVYINTYIYTYYCGSNFNPKSPQHFFCGTLVMILPENFCYLNVSCLVLIHHHFAPLNLSVALKRVGSPEALAASRRITLGGSCLV